MSYIACTQLILPNPLFRAPQKDSKVEVHRRVRQRRKSPMDSATMTFHWPGSARQVVGEPLSLPSTCPSPGLNLDDTVEGYLGRPVPPVATLTGMEGWSMMWPPSDRAWRPDRRI